MLKKLLLSLLVLCLAFLGSTRPSAADQVDRQTFNDPLSYLQAHGWKVVSDGVLQRERRAGEVETFVYGASGLTWKLQDLQNQLTMLRGLFQAHPDADLRKAIVHHRQEIANTQKMLEIAKEAEEKGVAPIIPKDTCTISYTYNADAGYFTSAQGTWASANANFSDSCSLDGTVYAYATATATVNGAPTTQTVTDGPRSSTSSQYPNVNVSASAYAYVYGGASCSSYAYASVSSNSLNPSSYYREASNSSCPVPVQPPTPAISGTDYIYVSSGCVTTTWTSSVSGGTSPYTYQWTWNGVAVGTGSSYSRSVCAGSTYSYTSNTLGLTVTDSLGLHGSDSLGVDVEKDPATSCYVASDPNDPNKFVPICPQ